MNGLAGVLRRAAAVLILVWIVLPAHDARAHAALVETLPADGAVLGHPPAEIVLRFSEAVTPVAFRVTAADGTHRDLRPESDAAQRAVRLPMSGLSNGSYLLSWRVVSADSHPIGGAIAFSVGGGSARVADARNESAEREAWWQFAAMINRAVGDVALLSAAGAALFFALVLGGRLPADLPVRRVSAAATAVGLLSLGAAVAISGAWLLAAPVLEVFAAETWRAGFGTNAVLRSGIGATGLILAAAGVFALPRCGASFAAAAGALIAAGSFALSGHVAALDPSWPGQLALAIHAIAVAFWLGSLWPLHRIVSRHPAEAAAPILRRFSAIAIPAVAVLAIAGTGVALTRVRSVEALVGTIYGRILIFKLAFVAMMVVIAVRNRRLSFALAARPAAGALLARNIRVEIGFAGVILLLTAILAHTPPGQRINERHAHQASSALTITAESRGHRVDIEITPGARGPNRIAASIVAPSGRPLAATEVIASLSLPESGIEPLVRPMQPGGAGIYVVERVELPVAGRWQLQIEILISDFEKLSIPAELDIR